MVSESGPPGLFSLTPQGGVGASGGAGVVGEAAARV